MLGLNITYACKGIAKIQQNPTFAITRMYKPTDKKILPLNNFLVSRHSYEHDELIMRYFLHIIATLAGLLACYAIWQDLTSSYSASAPLGRLWYLYSPTTLQATESIISRYIDPCGLIAALDCSPFLWHPIIATILGWPAALVMIGFSVIFWWVGSLFGRKSMRPRKAARSLRRQGEK
jgi:hypothetical protein